ncbi:hypothetical protein [Sulfoacidibacillus thermotolerans]|uniref:NTP pyrophosphohydrolase MazG putative catalytic core domain-containing protein n=1 Tax=Sulfoacidibacillus thermotolerans TaxID=1765684 RepID=A0A2U3D3L5_SULT2|nr:hypothetical protein [Sulfoacidibacillus thermotolerans]PWI55848.1 hypothetical protein BM613_13265 [Sulfoacidibacillus thermotolerans]
MSILSRRYRDQDLRFGNVSSPPSEVVTYTLTPEELEAFNQKYGLPPVGTKTEKAPTFVVPEKSLETIRKEKEHAKMALTKNAYLSARAQGKSKKEIQEIFGVTPQGLGGALYRWGVSKEKDEAEAIRAYVESENQSETIQHKANPDERAQVVEELAIQEVEEEQKKKEELRALMKESPTDYLREVSKTPSNPIEQITEEEIQFDAHQQMMLLTLNMIADEVHETAREKGWHEEELPFPVAIALIHSEVSESLAADRSGEGNVAEELADVILRVLDSARTYQLDVSTALVRKMAKIDLRAYRHGGKKY